MGKELEILENGRKIAVWRLARTYQQFVSQTEVHKNPYSQSFYSFLAQAALASLKKLETSLSSQT